MSNDDKSYRPKVTDFPALQIVEVENTVPVDRLGELGDVVNRINPPDPDQTRSCWSWN